MPDNYYVTVKVEKGKKPRMFNEFKVEDYGIKPNEDYIINGADSRRGLRIVGDRLVLDNTGAMFNRLAC